MQCWQLALAILIVARCDPGMALPWHPVHQTTVRKDMPCLARDHDTDAVHCSFPPSSILQALLLAMHIKVYCNTHSPSLQAAHWEDGLPWGQQLDKYEKRCPCRSAHNFLCISPRPLFLLSIQHWNLESSSHRSSSRQLLAGCYSLILARILQGGISKVSHSTMAGRKECLAMESLILNLPCQPHDLRCMLP